MSNPADLERVLREDDWLRRIARRLAGDPDVAEDLAQDAWVAALASGRSDRPWLFGVVRNLRRAGARRAARDERLRETVPEPEQAPATDEVVDELLLRKRVTDGLLELEEPYRTTLYRRFVQGQRLSRIARESEVAVSTVHQRVARGLELLRRRLDEQYDGRRQAWALGLLSLAKSSGLAVSIGGLVLGTSVKFIAAILVAGGAWLWLWQGRGHVEEVADVAPAVIAVMAAVPEAVVEAPQPSREEVALAAGTHEPEQTPAANASALLLGLVVDLDGRPVTAVRVGYEGRDGAAESEAVGRTDGLGLFTLRELDTKGEQDEARIACLEPHLVTLVHGLPRDGRHLVVVGRKADFSGLVVDPEGVPISGAELRFDLRQSLFREHGVVRPWVNSQRKRVALADEFGRFELADTCGGAHVGLWVVADGFESRFVDLPADGHGALRIVLTPDEGERMLEGVVLDLRGAGVPGAQVSAGREIVRTDADGAFRLSWRLGGAGNHVKGDDGTWRSQYDTSVLRALKAGHLPAEVRIDELARGETIVLRLGAESLSIRARLVDERGEPRGGFIMWASGLTHFGLRIQSAGKARSESSIYLEHLLNPTRDRRGALTDDDGRVELSGMLPREYELHAYDPATATEGGPWLLEPGEEEVELVLASEPGTVRVAGRIVTASGMPIPGVWMLPRRNARYNDGRQPPHLEGVELGTHTDEEGRFAFEALATRGTVFELQHDSFFIAHFGLEGRRDLGALEIVQPVLCELQVELADSEMADSVVVLDESGEKLELLESMGAFLMMGDIAGIEEGKSAVLQLKETARTLVLQKDGQEVLRRRLQLDPTQRTDVRF